MKIIGVLRPPLGLVSAALFALTMAAAAWCVEPGALEISTGAGKFSFPGRWLLLPSAMSLQTADSGAPAIFRVLAAPQTTQYRRLNNEHLQLNGGALVVSAQGRPLFVSEKFGPDKIMIRIAPGAVALINSGETPVIANLSKRCCGAVLVYVPATGADKDNGKVNVLSGELLKVLPNGTAGAGRSLQTSAGMVALSIEKIDIDRIMQDLANLPEQVAQ